MGGKLVNCFLFFYQDIFTLKKEKILDQNEIFYFHLPFAKVIVFGNEDFEEFAKVFSVVFVQEFKIAKVKIEKFRDFSVLRNFLPAKVSALKVR